MDVPFVLFSRVFSGCEKQSQNPKTAHQLIWKLLELLKMNNVHNLLEWGIGYPKIGYYPKNTHTSGLGKFGIFNSGIFGLGKTVPSIW